MLYFIPTPIGNLRDITLRAMDLFQSLDVFFCEDTRTFKDLLKHYDIDFSSKKLYSFTSFTNDGQKKNYLDILKQTDCGFVSEAGTPGLSDPGKEMVKIVWENDIKFEVLPGANALLPSVVGSYFDTSSFVFMGFLPKKKGKQTAMKYIISSEIPVFIYESVHRVTKTLEEMKKLGFTGKVMVSREQTKMFDQKVCEDIASVLSKLHSGEIVEKGEFVIGFFNVRQR